MQGGGLARRIDAEEDAHARRHHQSGHDRRRVHDRVPAPDSGQHDGTADAQSDSDDASDEGDDGGLDQELKQNVARIGPNGFTNADLAGALGDGDQHDVHDADASDHQGDDGDGGEQGGHGIGDALLAAQNLRLAANFKIVVIGEGRLQFVLVAQVVGDLLLRQGHHVLSGAADGDAVDVGAIDDSAHGGGDGADDNVVLILPERAGAFGSEHAHDGELFTVDGDGLADEI